MDFGLRGKTALVCAASKGLGRGCAEALAAEGAALVINARGAEELATTAAHIRAAYGVGVIEVAADATTREGRAALLAACPNPDILVNNAGGPPPGDWSDWDEEAWEKALAANMVSPIQLTRAVLPGMMARRWGRIINITSISVKAPIPQLGLSNGARSGLTGFMAGLARQMAPHGVTVNNLLPGAIDTDRIRALDKAAAAKTGRSFEEAAAARRASIPAGRLGTPAEFGAACAFLCSVQAAYITGQNLLLDGGAYPAAF